jgi:nicotinate-nucleotide adenylyltransferase
VKGETMDIGVLGGTFDPVHVGHIAIAKAARDQLNLSQVLFVPAGVPWLKGHRDITPAERRVEMLELAIAPYPSFRVSRVELERPGHSYTTDTLEQLKRELGGDAELYFILGEDALSEMPLWHQPQRIIELCRPVAARRPGSRPPDIESLEGGLPGISKRVIILDNEPVDASSSGIRERVASGMPIEGLVPDAVAGYIAERGLYRKGGLN